MASNTRTMDATTSSTRTGRPKHTRCVLPELQKSGRFTTIWPSLDILRSRKSVTPTMIVATANIATRASILKRTSAWQKSPITRLVILPAVIINAKAVIASSLVVIPPIQCRWAKPAISMMPAGRVSVVASMEPRAPASVRLMPIVGRASTAMPGWMRPRTVA